MKSTAFNLITCYPARLLAYGLVTMLTFFGVHELVQLYGADWLAHENGPIEMVQVGCLLIAATFIILSGDRPSESGRSRVRLD